MPDLKTRYIALLALAALAAGCGTTSSVDSGAFGGTSSNQSDGSEGTGGDPTPEKTDPEETDPGETDSEGTDEIKFDLGSSDLPEEECDEAEGFPHEPCEDGVALDYATGINCPGEPEFEMTLAGHPDAASIQSSFGDTNEWDPREGESFVVLGTGRPDTALFAVNCNQSDDVDDANHTCGNEHDVGTTLPDPIDPVDVGNEDCTQNPDLIGTGDCSSSLATEWSAGLVGSQCPGANDYAEFRLTAIVPSDATSISFDVAFFTKEYPTWVGSGWNDMFVAWLESSQWTGNISFDDEGNPLTLNAALFNFKDDAEILPELAGTCMQGNGGTRWLTTTAPVAPGEEIELVLSIFDVGDNAFDSYAFIDNVRFGCEDGPPLTEPAG
jgi:hypothetical protein